MSTPAEGVEAEAPDALGCENESKTQTIKADTFDDFMVGSGHFALNDEFIMVVSSSSRVVI